MKKITIIGTGYVGLVTGACLAEMGNHVTCLDIDREKIKSLSQGHLTFYEPDLKELVKKNVNENRLHFTEKYSQAIPGAEILFLALPTPSSEDGSCDLSYIELAATEFARHIEKYIVIVNKSTVPVGTSARLREILEDSLSKDVEFDVVSNPEFLREGAAVSDCMNPDRIILGVSNEKSAQIMRDLYKPYILHEDRILIMDIPSAELAKYAANVMLASRISLMNHFALLCETLGANVEDVQLAMSFDERIGPHYLNPGIGFGGSCLPKDVNALRSVAKRQGIKTPILDGILEVNQEQKVHFLEKILHYFETLHDKTLAIWGLSFKPDTDDLREAPSLFLIQKLLEKGAHLKLYDPEAMEKAKPLFENFSQVTFCSDEYDAAQDADGIILVTEWKQFQLVNFDKIGKSLKQKVLFDGRNQYNLSEMQKLGFDYFCIGKQPLSKMAYA